MNTLLTRNTWLLLSAISTLLFSLSAQAASFDCGKARTRGEHIICDTPEISKLDEELAAAYKATLKDEKRAGSIRQAQKQWLKERNGCEDTDCFEMAYRGRVAELNLDQATGRFIPILIKDKSLCESYKRYVEHEAMTEYQYVHNASPMCQRNFGGAFPKFTPVKWHEISPEEHQELAVQAYRYINFWPWGRPEVSSYFTDSEFKMQLETIEVNHKNNWWHMWLGEADIGNTGHMETLLRVEDGRCGEESMTGRPPRWSIPVMVVDASGKGIDTAKSEWVIGVTKLTSIDQLPSNLRDRAIPGLHSTLQSTFDTFIFSGKVFFDRWEEVWELPHSYLADQRFSRLTVYKISQEKPEAICRFKFRKQAN